MKYYKSKKIIEQNSIISLWLCLFVALCVIYLSGCGQQQKAAGIAIKTETSEVSRTMQAAEDVLFKMHFNIEKADYDKGYIRTRPLPGAQFFEFWRSDNVGFDNQLLSNMHSIRRIVELNISNAEGEYNTECKVHVQRLSIPQREITSSAHAFQLFTRSSLEFQRLALHPEQEKEMAWLELDRDTKLEAEILKRISSTMDKKDRDTQSKTNSTEEKI